MPIISAFYGMTIYMYYLDNKMHSLPHIHIIFENTEYVVSIPEGILLEGRLPKKLLKILKKWMKENHAQLMENWNFAIAGMPIKKIDPLK